MRTLLHHVGRGGHFELRLQCDFGFNVSLGEKFYFDCIILDATTVSIGDGVLFGSRVGLYTVNHPLILTNALLEARTYINPSVTVGDNTIIGSGSA